MSAWPSVGVVIPTRDRPGQLREAIASVLAQDYPGRLQVVVVFDGAPVDQGLAGDARLLVLDNDRVPGLAGARNCGFLGSRAGLVAFCDEHERWLRGKLPA